MMENMKKIISELITTADVNMLCHLIQMYRDILVLEHNLKEVKDGEKVQTEEK